MFRDIIWHVVAILLVLVAGYGLTVGLAKIGQASAVDVKTAVSFAVGWGLWQIASSLATMARSQVK